MGGMDKVRRCQRHDAVLPILSLLTIALLSAPSAMAGADVDGVVVAAQVEDHRAPEDCAVDPCLATAEGETPGNASVDVSQRYRYVGVALQGERIEDASGGTILLPDASITQSGSQIFVSHSVLVLLTQTWAGVEPHQPGRGAVGPELNDYRFGVYYHGPSLADPQRWGDQVVGMRYGAPLNYDRVGPVKVQQVGDTDYLASGWHVLACDSGVAEAECADAHGDATSAYKSSTPNVTFGLTFYDAEIAAHAEDLGRDAAEAADAASEAMPTFARGEAPPPPADERRLPVLSGTIVPERARPALPPASDPAGAPAPTSPHSTQDVVVQLSHPDSDLLEKGAVALAAGALLALLGFSLYSRITSPSALLRSRPRGQLYELVQANPGMCLTDATGPLGLTRNAIAHHVRMMQRARLLEVVEDDGRKLLFPAGARPRNPVQVSHGVWNHPVRGRILRVLLDAGGSMPRQDLHALLHEVPERTRNYTLARLVEKGVLEIAPDALGVPRVRLVGDAAAASGAHDASGAAHAS